MMKEPTHFPLLASQLSGLKHALLALILLFVMQATAHGQVEVELKRGGTLEGTVIAADDSSVTLRIEIGENGTRDAVLRRSDLIFLEGSDEVLPSATGTEAAASQSNDSTPSFEYRNELTFGISTDGILFDAFGNSSSHVNYSEAGYHYELAYEFTTVPRVWDEAHTLQSSRRVIPTTYVSVASITNPYGKTPWQSRTEQLFYAQLVQPDMALGGGVTFESYHGGALSDRYELYVFSGRADFFPSTRVRVREAAGAGWVDFGDDLFADTSGTVGAVAMLQHRLDYFIGEVFFMDYFFLTLGYVQEIQLQYIEDAGTYLDINNGVEYSFTPTLSLHMEIPLHLAFAEHGDMQANLGLGAGISWYPIQNWSVRFSSTRTDRDSSSQLLLSWQF